MRVVRNLFGWSVLIFICAAGTVAQSVQTDYDRTFNLAVSAKAQVPAG